MVSNHNQNDGFTVFAGLISDISVSTGIESGNRFVIVVLNEP
jgi:hypothetical protein